MWRFFITNLFFKFIQGRSSFLFPLVSVVLGPVFQGTCPFHLSSWTYLHEVVHNIPLLSLMSVESVVMSPHSFLSMVISVFSFPPMTSKPRSFYWSLQGTNFRFSWFLPPVSSLLISVLILFPFFYLVLTSSSFPSFLKWNLWSLIWSLYSF